LKQVIIVETLNVGHPPLIDIYRQDRARVAPLEEKVLGALQAELRVGR